MMMGRLVTSPVLDLVEMMPAIMGVDRIVQTLRYPGDVRVGGGPVVEAL